MRCRFSRLKWKSLRSVFHEQHRLLTSSHANIVRDWSHIPKKQIDSHAVSSITGARNAGFYTETCTGLALQRLARRCLRSARSRYHNLRRAQIAVRDQQARQHALQGVAGDIQVVWQVRDAAQIEPELHVVKGPHAVLLVTAPVVVHARVRRQRIEPHMHARVLEGALRPQVDPVEPRRVEQGHVRALAAVAVQPAVHHRVRAKRVSRRERGPREEELPVAQLGKEHERVRGSGDEGDDLRVARHQRAHYGGVRRRAVLDKDVEHLPIVYGRPVEIHADVDAHATHVLPLPLARCAHRGGLRPADEIRSDLAFVFVCGCDLAPNSNKKML